MKHLKRKKDADLADIAYARFSLLALAVAYTIFVIYGSLVPLNYQQHSWQWALETFRNISYLNLGIGSRADWVANILLFIPLAFLWQGTFWHSRNIVWRVLATLLVLFGCISLCVTIEFTQLFFPPRTVSLNDIYAETLGAIIGLTLWWAIGAAVIRWYLGWRSAKGAIDLAQRLLYIYLFLLFGYNLLPLDLTISPVEIYHKWRGGRIILIPFMDGQINPVQRFYGLLTDVLAWIPAGVLANLSALRSVRHMWLKLTAAAALIEFLQIFVYTRVTDTTDILTACLGSAIGIWLVSRWRVTQTSTRQEKPANNSDGLITGLLFWLILVFSVFWYPFDFQLDGAFVRGQFAEATSRVPFSLYYFGTEFRAATEVFHKLGFFFPLGVLLTLLVNRMHFVSPSLRKVLVLAGLAVIAASVEAGQLFLPGKFADLTDWVLETAGAWAGCALAWRMQVVQRIPTVFTKATSFKVASDKTAPVILESRYSPWLFVAGLVLGIALLLLAATHFSAVPYNIRELVAEDYPLLSAFSFAIAVVWIFGFPAWAVNYLATGKRQSATLPVYLLMHAIVAWILLRIAVPLESIHDIVGSPILSWPWEWEMLGRFVALFALWSVVLFGAVLIVLRSWLPKSSILVWMWAITSIIVLPVSYVIVIQQAATDNLTELLDGGGTPMAFIWVAAGVFILALASTQLASTLGTGLRVGVKRGIFWGVASFPLTYLALHAGFESYIIKYNQVFSTFQFLLSQDRAHYASTKALLLRYAIVHGALLFVITVSQLPFLGRAGLVHNNQKAGLTSVRKRTRRRRSRI
jgi:VanZ family protein